MKKAPSAKLMASFLTPTLPQRGAKYFTLFRLKMILNQSLPLVVLCLGSGCPVANLPLGVSETVQDFGDSDCLWAFYVYNSGGNLGAFRVASDVPWARVVTPVGVVTPNGHTPVVVSINRAWLDSEDGRGALRVTYGNDNAFEDLIDLYATDGDTHYVRLLHYWPFAVGNEWVYASRAEDAGGLTGDKSLIETSRFTVVGHAKRFGLDIWTTKYERFQSNTSILLYAVILDEYPVFVNDPGAINLLPNREAFFGAALTDDITEFWMKGIFEPGDLGVYTNSTRYTTLTLREITPMHYLYTTGKLRASDFPVPRATACFALLDDSFNHPRQRRHYFALLGRGVGPLTDPFGDSGILQRYGNPAR